MEPTIVIEPARVDESERILQLQYLCFRSQAAMYDDWSMPPLTQPLHVLLGEYDTKTILVARLGEEIVGSVRANMEDGVCHVDRLFVHPRLRGAGLGTRLMEKIEGYFPDALWFELFTGHKSEANLRLYRELGYEAYRKEVESPKVTLVYMHKPGAD